MTARRTCVACRQDEERAELVRLVRLPDGAVAVDYRGRMPGRGAWVHPRPTCIARVSPGQLARALRCERIELGDLHGAIRDRVLAAAGEGLSMAAAGGALVGGTDVLTRSLRDGVVAEVVVADDASERTIDGLKRVAGPDLPFTALGLDRPALGQRVGQGARAAVGVLRSPASEHLRRQLRRLRNLG